MSNAFRGAPATSPQRALGLIGALGLVLGLSGCYVANAITDSGGGAPQQAAVDPSSHTAYAAVQGQSSGSPDHVAIYQGGALAKTIGLAGAARVAVDSSTGTAYVTSSTANTVAVINNGAITATVGVGNSPQGIGVDSSTHTVYVANNVDKTVSVINGGTVTSTLSVAGAFELAVDSSSHTVYVTNHNGDSVSVISGETVASTIPVGHQPIGVAVDPSTHTAYVANFGDHTVSVISAGTVTDTITVPSGAWGVATDPSTHTLYVSGGGNVSVIDNKTVTTTVRVALFPGLPAVDPSTHVIYSPDGLFDPSSGDPYPGSMWTIARFPEITSVTPQDGSTGVSTATTVSATFDVAMDPSSTTAAFSLVRTSDKVQVAGSAAFSGDRKLIFTPSSPLAPNTQYTATVSTTATDTGGTHLVLTRSWSFTTR